MLPAASFEVVFHARLQSVRVERTPTTLRWISKCHSARRPLLLALERIEYKNQPLIENSEYGRHAGDNFTWALGTSMRQPLQYRYPLPR